MALPPPTDSTPVTRVARPIALAAVAGGGFSLFTAIVGLILIGYNSAPQDAITALSTVAGSLAGAFAGWMARGATEIRRDE